MPRTILSPSQPRHSSGVVTRDVVARLYSVLQSYASYEVLLRGVVGLLLYALHFKVARTGGIMLATVLSSAVHGIDALLVEVEVDIASGMPQMAVVGLPEGAVKESKDRVRSALEESGYEFPARRITINLAPADIKKEGSAYDLPIGLGILAATGQLPPARLREYSILGELSLDGRVKPVRGALPIAASATEKGLRGILLPAAHAIEAAVVNGIDIISVGTLAEAFEFLRDERVITPVTV